MYRSLIQNDRMKLIYQNVTYTSLEAIDDMNKDLHEPWLQEVILTLRQWGQRSDVTIHTSGSTGKPKNIELSFDQLVQSALKTIEYFGLLPGQLLWCCLPAQYIAGKMMLIRGLVGELEILITKPSSDPMVDLDRKVDFAAMTPMQLAHGLKNHPEKIDLLKTIILGGGPVDNSLLSQLQEIDASVSHLWHDRDSHAHSCKSS